MRMIRVAVAGTPATGKSVFAKKLAAVVPSSSIIEVNEVARAFGLFTGTGRDGTKTVDIKALGHAMAAELRKKSSERTLLVIVAGHLVPYIGMHFDVAVVTRCSLRVLLTRLKSRGYTSRKISDNLLCEAVDCIGADMVGKAPETYEIASNKDAKVLLDYISSIAAGKRHARPKLKEIDLMKEMYSMIKKGEFGFRTKS